MSSTSTYSLVRLLCNLSEKAAIIARQLRSDPILFSLLIEEKGSKGNSRFSQDFKTLADVLIQEMVRKEVTDVFPGLTVQGEEDAIFTNSVGEQVTIGIGATAAVTAETLVRVIGTDAHVAAEALAALVHKSITCSTPSEEKLSTLPDCPEQERLGIWIDPIDGTNEYIRGGEGGEGPGFRTGGLPVVTVLIGVFDKYSGDPLIGVVNQPFWRYFESTSSYEGRHIWGVSLTGGVKESSIDYTGFSGDNIANACLMSSSEDESIRLLASEHFSRRVFASGGGFKLLCVIDGFVGAYLLSKESTYKWDTCGPHAILRAIGGDVVRYTDGGPINYNKPDDVAITNSHQWANSVGIIGYGPVLASSPFLSTFHKLRFTEN